MIFQLFPSWQGGFDGSRPSLHGLPNERVIAALEAGLITETELNALLHLIRSPDVRSFVSLANQLMLTYYRYTVSLPKGTLFAVPLSHQYPRQVPL